MMGSHLTLCKNSGNITPSPPPPSPSTHIHRQKFALVWSRSVLKTLPHLVLSFFNPFWTLSPSVTVLPDALSFMPSNQTVFQQHTIKAQNPSIRTLFSSGKPPTIICWAAGVANIRLLGEREVLQLLSIACVYDVQPEQKSYICLHQQWAINLTLSELKFLVI